MPKRNSPQKELRRRGAPKGNHNAQKHTCVKHGLDARSPGSPVYQDQPASNGAFKNEIAALRRIFLDYTLAYDRAETQEDRDRATQILCLLSVRMAQLARAQHFITPPEDPQWTELIRAGEAILRDKPIMDLFRPKDDLTPGSGHDQPPFLLFNNDLGAPS